MIATKKSKNAVDAKYFRLIRHFPLRPLRDDADHVAAGSILDELVGKQNLSTGEVDYLGALAQLVSDYEKNRFKLKRLNLTPLEMLMFLVEENQMSTTDLGYIVGSRGLASEILHGKRGLSKTLILKLSQKFKVDPSVFF